MPWIAPACPWYRDVEPVVDQATVRYDAYDTKNSAAGAGKPVQNGRSHATVTGDFLPEPRPPACGNQLV